MGLFEQAHGGTLVLDGIGEISPAIQSKLLRALQEHQVRRIGDNKVIDVDVRILSATNRSISHLADQGLFRRDLVYRLDVLRLFIPPLRDREDDVELLFDYLLKVHCQESGVPIPLLSPDARSLLHSYPFQGNIRELKNIVERACVLCDGGCIPGRDLQNALYPRDLEPEEVSRPSSPLPAASEPERLLQALESCGGNRTKAARLLGMDRSTLWRKLQKYHLS